MQLADGEVIDESLDVMHWALAHNDPAHWLDPDPARRDELVDLNDGVFKTALDQYKYFTRFPEQPREHYRAQGEVFLHKLEDCLAEHDGIGLTATTTALADIAIFPFVRQFAGADPAWFSTAPYPLLRNWLDSQVNSALFKRVMRKYPQWQTTDVSLIEDWQAV